eukprot:COSAG06_NODE_23869_length_679_cov_1.036207_1_plen_32_part_10
MPQTLEWIFSEEEGGGAFECPEDPAAAAATMA